MKISIINKNINNSWTVDELTNAAKKHKVKTNVINIRDVNDLKSVESQLGDVVLWRTSGLDTKSERSSMGLLFNNRYVINDAIFRTPFIPFKFYQQTMVANHTKLNSIATYRFKNSNELKEALENNKLSYPFIAKPNYGAQGTGVLLIKTVKQLTELKGKYKDYIFQNFIPNTGDYRVIVLGGRSLGVMKRIAAKGSHLNNISKGGTSVLESDPSILSEVQAMATTAASIFELSFCGVDIVQDSNTGKFYFLEINTVPQWDGEYGFKSITGVDVADEIIKHCIQMNLRNKKPAYQLVRHNYDTNFDSLEKKQIHYASRMYLWTGDKVMKQHLLDLKQDYIGITSQETFEKLNTIYNKKPVDKPRNIKLRRKYYKKYPKLTQYNSILFKVLFAETIYGEDIRPVVKEIVSDKELLTFYRDLKQDKDAIRVLSTGAINYLYNLNFYFKYNHKLCEETLIDPAYLLSLVKTFEGKIGNQIISKDHELKLKLYLLTHAVIGASNFYFRSTKGVVYKQMMKLTEELIFRNYFDITLDNKVEFLVCTALCNMDTLLRKLIENEAEQSLAKVGNFIVDSINNSSDWKIKYKMSPAEHRNVLYIMSQLPFKNIKLVASQKSTKQFKPDYQQLPVLGRSTSISFCDQNINDIEARVDTGADYSAIHATDVRELKDNNGKYLSFRLLDPSHKAYQLQEIKIRDYEKVNVRNTTGDLQQRYAIRIEVAIQGKKFVTPFTLADRSKMLYPVLLGRRALSRNFLVDTSQRSVDNKK